MPNWCETTYKCVGDPKEVRELHNIIKENAKRDTPRVPNGFGRLWLGCIIDQLGYDWEKYRCRGEIIDYDIDYDNRMLTIYQNTAWCEQEGFREAIEKKFPSIHVFYLQEEPGCEVYSTNDADGEYFDDKYLLYYEDGTEYFETIEDVAEFLSSEMEKEIAPTLEAVKNALSELRENNDGYYNICELEIYND